MLTDVIAIAAAAGGAGMIVLAFRQAKTKGWGGSLQMMAAGLLLIGASAVGLVGFLAGIVFNPLKWLGVVAMGLGTVLFIAGQRLEGKRGLSRRDESDSETSEKSAEPKAVEGKKKQDSAAAGTDDDMSDIEDILRRHGIE